VNRVIGSETVKFGSELCGVRKILRSKLRFVRKKLRSSKKYANRNVNKKNESPPNLHEHSIMCENVGFSAYSA
jgi:hypothetical protein